jgi:hypothetical protein
VCVCVCVCVRARVRVRVRARVRSCVCALFSSTPRRPVLVREPAHMCMHAVGPKHRLADASVTM